AVLLTPAARMVPLLGPRLTTSVWTAVELVLMGVAAWLLFRVVTAVQDMRLALAITIVGVPAMYAMGALFGAGVLRFGEIGPAVQFTRGGLSMLCGITFPIAMLPGWAQATATAMPPTYIVDGMRSALLKSAGPADLLPAAATLLALAVGFAGIAVLVFRWLEASARRSGMLGRY